MRFMVVWQYQGRTCTVETDSQINADLCGMAISAQFACDSKVLTGENHGTEVTRFKDGQRQ